MAVKVGMVSLGCSKNQVDGEIMLSLIQRDGYELCGVQYACGKGCFEGAGSYILLRESVD